MRKTRHSKGHLRIITALLLVILMAFSILPLSAFAMDADQKNTEIAPNSEELAGLGDQDDDTNKKSEDKSGVDAGDSNASTGKDENKPETPAEEEGEQKESSDKKPETNLVESSDVDKKDGASKDREAWKKALEEKLKKGSKEDPDIQLFSIIQPTKPTYTYIFKVDDTEYDKQIVKNGEKLLEPETPEKAHHRFLGWQQENPEGSGNYVDFDFSEPISIAEDATSQEIELVANFEEVYYVYFMWPRQGEVKEEDKDKYEVIASHEGKPGESIKTTDIISPDMMFHDIISPELEGQEFEGWYKDKKLTDACADPLIIGNEDITLWPKFQPTGYWLHFFPGEGASTVISQFVKRNSTPAIPDPTRFGYTFKHWSSSKDGPEFDFAQELTKDTDLYAVWDLAKAKYTVVFWKQRATDDKNAPNDQKTYDLVEVYKDVREGTTDAIVRPTNEDENWANTKDEFQHFHYNSENSKEVIVKPDGSTVLNVYYDRDLFYIKLHFRDESGLYPDDKVKTITGLYGSVLMEGTPDYKIAYESDASVGKDDWQYMWSGSKEKPKPSIKLDEQNKPVEPNKPDVRGFPLTFRFEGPNYDFGNVTKTDKENDTAHLYQRPDTPANLVNWIDFQRLNGKYPDVNDGFDADETSIGVYGTYYPNLGVYKGFTLAFFSKKNEPTEDEWESFAGKTEIDTTGSEQHRFRIRASRNEYKLTFRNYNETITSKTLLYQEPLKGYSFTPSRPEHLPDYYGFKGWYKNYKDGEFTNKCDFDKETMPYNDMVLFAKWGPKSDEDTMAIAYCSKLGGDKKTLTTEYGDIIEKESLPKVVREDGTLIQEGDADYLVKIPNSAQWIGWTTKDAEGKYQLYSFGQAVYKRTELYPYYIEKGLYTVTYHYPGNDGSEKNKIDPKTYTKHSQADVLPWPPDGKVPEGKIFLAWTTNKEVSDKSAVPVASTSSDSMQVGQASEFKLFATSMAAVAAKSGYTPKDAIVVENNVDFYPVFGPIPEEVQITYDGNGGELPGGANTVKFDPVANNSLLKILDNTEADGLGFKRTVQLSSGPHACEFRLWEYTRKGKTYKTKPGDEYTLDSEDPNNNVLRAVWAKPIEIKVTTVWEDQDNKAKKRPDHLDVQLRRDGTDLGDPLKLNPDVKWQGWFGQDGDLLDIDEACNPYTYDIVAPDVTGYKKTVKGDVKNGFTISYTLPVEPSPEGRKYVVIVDPNGGVWPDGSSENLRYLFDGGDIFTLPEPPSKAGHVFDYWQGSRYNPGDEYVVTEDHYFLAIWNPTEVPEIRVPIPVGGQTSTPSPSRPTPMQATPVPAQVVALPRTGESRLESYSLSASLGLLAGVLILLRKKYKA
ncbi:MAG: InlB B-repeat-containing protein [Eubacteriales bacterium]|nr:InlB B-repeat-containing protein [Clostridiales bacterium]MDY5836876.1 InlB B-repeat-containing protein [Eubacteriales bacterium]